MRCRALLPMLVLATAAPALAQTTATAEKPSITLYSLPAFLGQSITVTEATPNLSQSGFANRAQSARVTSGTWVACRGAAYAGQCQTITGDVPTLSILGLNKKVLSLRPNVTTTAGSTGTSSTTTPAAALADLDVGEGVEGQDVSFFARPTLQNQQVSAGAATDRTAADAFCKLAGHGTSVHAGRARTQVSNIWNVTTGARVRGYPLRDVLCRK